MRRFLAFLPLGLACCTEKPSPPLSALAPRPLPSIVMDAGEDREAAFRVRPAPLYGDPLPKDAVAVLLWEGKARLGARDLQEADLQAGKPLLLVPDAQTYLAQVSALFASLDRAHVPTWLALGDRSAAFPLELKDEHAFQAWIDEPKPGKVRIIQRADGFELQTNIGKLPGGDPNGPSIPVRGGQQDIAGLRYALGRLKGRFDTTPDVCLVPSFGTPLVKSAVALSADYTAMGKRSFDGLCFVYPAQTESGLPPPTGWH